MTNPKISLGIQASRKKLFTSNEFHGYGKTIGKNANNLYLDKPPPSTLELLVESTERKPKASIRTSIKNMVAFDQLPDYLKHS